MPSSTSDVESTHAGVRAEGQRERRGRRETETGWVGESKGRGGAVGLSPRMMSERNEISSKQQPKEVQRPPKHGYVPGSGSRALSLELEDAEKCLDAVPAASPVTEASPWWNLVSPVKAPGCCGDEPSAPGASDCTAVQTKR